MNEILLSNIKILAEQKDFTIAGLEKFMNFGLSSISKWNKSDPSLSKVCKVAEHLGVTIDTLCNVPLDSESIQAKSVVDKFIKLLIEDKIKLVLVKGVEYRAEIGHYRFTYYEDNYNLILLNKDGVSRTLRLNKSDDKTIKSVIHKQAQDVMLVDALEFLSTIN